MTDIPPMIPNPAYPGIAAAPAAPLPPAPAGMTTVSQTSTTTNPRTGAEVETVIAKPGMRTTEFWLALIVVIVGGIMTLMGAWKGDNIIMQTGSALMGVSSVGYGVTRSISKK